MEKPKFVQIVHDFCKHVSMSFGVFCKLGVVLLFRKFDFRKSLKMSIFVVVIQNGGVNSDIPAWVALVMLVFFSQHSAELVLRQNILAV